MRLSPSGIALLIAFIATLGCALLLYLMVGSFSSNLVSMLALLLFGTWAVGWYLIKRFAHERIDLLFQSIHALRTNKRTGSDPITAAAEEVHEWAEEQREEIKDLQQREKFRREFIGNLAHELKTPITSIQGYILTLMEGGLEDEKVNRDFLGRAANGVDRLNHIVNDLDMITKLESGVMALDATRTDLREILQAAKEAVLSSAKSKGITYELGYLNESATWIMVDKERMIQVLMNLFTNAVSYGKEDGSIKITVHDMNQRVLVDVEDDGIGMAPEHLPRLFERFYRVDTSRARNEGGSGLGLAIVKHIMDAHGERISVKSKEGKGTTFSLTLLKAK